MRKTLKIIFYIITMAFILKRQLSPVKINEEMEIYIFIIYLTLAIPYAIYGINQQKKEGKLNNAQANVVLLTMASFIIIALISFFYY